MLDDPVNGGDQEGEGTGDHHQQLVARAADVENRDEQGTRGEQQKDVRDRLGWLERLKARDQGGADQQRDAHEDRWQLAAIRPLEEGAVDEHAEDDQRKQELERLARQADVGAERLGDLEPVSGVIATASASPYSGLRSTASTIAPSQHGSGQQQGVRA